MASDDAAAALQRDLVARMLLDMAADPPSDALAIPHPRAVPHQEKADWP